MSRHTFRALVVLNQLFLFGGYFIREATDPLLPPELNISFEASVLQTAEGALFSAEQFPYYASQAVNLLTLIAAVGLCLGRRWGRSLYLACFVLALALTPLTPLYVDTSWTVMAGSLYGTTEGMILALAYFSSLRRTFDRTEESGRAEV